MPRAAALRLQGAARHADPERADAAPVFARTRGDRARGPRVTPFPGRDRRRLRDPARLPPWAAPLWRARARPCGRPQRLHAGEELRDARDARRGRGHGPCARERARGAAHDRMARRRRAARRRRRHRAGRRARRRRRMVQGVTTATSSRRRSRGSTCRTCSPRASTPPYGACSRGSKSAASSAPGSTSTSTCWTRRSCRPSIRPAVPDSITAQLSALVGALAASGRVAGMDFAIYDPERDPGHAHAADLVACIAASVRPRAAHPEARTG